MSKHAAGRPPIPENWAPRPPAQKKGFSGTALWVFIGVQAVMAVLTIAATAYEASKPALFNDPGSVFLGCILIWIIVDGFYVGIWAAIRWIKREGW